MKAEKLFIGLYNVGNKESLFYQKDSEHYYDLKIKKSVSISELQKDSLVLYKDVIKTPGSSFKRNFIRLYDLDRCKKISLNRVFIGKLCQVFRITKQTEFGSSLFDYGIHTEHVSRVIEKNLLLYCKNVMNMPFYNMITGEEYKQLPFFIERGVYYICDKPEHLHLFSEIIPTNQNRTTMMEKGKILEIYREWKRNNK